MILQTDLTVILHYSTLTCNRENCQAAERKHILLKKKSHKQQQKIMPASKYSILFLFFSYWFKEQVYVINPASFFSPPHIMVGHTLYTVYIHIYIYTCIYIYICVCVYTHTHTHTIHYIYLTESIHMWFLTHFMMPC